MTSSDRRELHCPLGTHLVRVHGLQAPVDEGREAPAILSLQAVCSNGATLGQHRADAALAARPGLEPYVFKSASGFRAFGCAVRKTRPFLSNERGLVAALSFTAAQEKGEEPSGGDEAEEEPPAARRPEATAPTPDHHAAHVFECSAPALVTGLVAWFDGGGHLCGVQARAGFVDPAELARLRDAEPAWEEPPPGDPVAPPPAAPPASEQPPEPFSLAARALGAVAAVRPLLPGRLGALLDHPSSPGWLDNLIVVVLAVVALAAALWFLRATFRPCPPEKRAHPPRNKSRRRQNFEPPADPWTTGTPPW